MAVFVIWTRMQGGHVTIAFCFRGRSIVSVRIVPFFQCTPCWNNCLYCKSVRRHVCADCGI